MEKNGYKMMIILYFFLIMFSQIVGAEEIDKYKVENFKFQRDIKLNGVGDKYDFFFRIDKYWNINESYLELIYSESEINRKSESTITLLLNDTPIRTIKLDEGNNYKQSIRINLPMDKMLVGEYNKITIAPYKRVSDDICEEIINPANWIIVHKSSYVNVSFKNVEDTTSLKEYPYPYLKLNEKKSVDCAILISEEMNSDMLKAAMLISSDFGRKKRYDRMDVNIDKLSEISKYKGSNIIIITKGKEIPKDIYNKLNENEKKAAEKEGLIKEVKSPYEEKRKILLIVSDKGSLILEATKLISNEEKIKQIEADSVIVYPQLHISEERKEPVKYITLNDLGYNDVILEGVFRKEKEFNVSIPKNIDVDAFLKIVLKMKYSRALNFNDSLVTVYIDDIPVGSKILKEDRNEDDILEVKVPKSVNKQNKFTLRVAFDFILREPLCDNGRIRSGWAYISNESYIQVSDIDKENMYLEDYEAPFVKNRNFNNILILIPNDDYKYLNYASSICGYLGSKAENIYSIDILKAEDFNEKLKYKNIIAIGTFENNPFIKDINHNLLIKFEDGDIVLGKEDNKIYIDEFNKENSIIQVIESPYKKQNKILLLSALNEEDLEWGIKYLTKDIYAQNLKGKVSLVDKNGYITWSYYDKNLNKKKVEVVEKEEYKEPIVFEGNRVIVVGMVILVVILTVLSLIVIKYRKSR